MMGTVWLRLHTSQDYIQPFINAIVLQALMDLAVPNQAHWLTTDISSSDPPS